MRILSWCRSNAMLAAAVLAAGVTAFFVPPDGEYLGYFDMKTLCCLFCVLAVVGALRDMNIFAALSQRLVRSFGSVRSVCTALVIITMAASMLLTNDTALLTFLPLGWFVLDCTGQRKHVPLLFVLQNCGANLSGMITPFGNPQNLYLYSYYGIGTGDFVSIMLPPFLISTALILAGCLLFPTTKLSVPDTTVRIEPLRTAVYAALFCLAVAMVLRAVPYAIGAAVTLAVLLVLDRRAIAGLDWGLLGTFAAFFVFSGNLARIEAVHTLFASLLSHGVMAVSALTSQLISNVPAAILLSRFTEDYASLLVGVNIGGTGTLIASLAGLITFREYTRHEPEKAGRFFALFSAVGFALLALLLGAMSLIR